MLLLDRLSSFVTGLGTAKDKSTQAGHVHVARSAEELRAAYRDNWLARKAVDIVPFDMLREWRAWQADEKQVGLIEAAEVALDLPRKLNAGMVRGRLFGGGAILIGDGAADPAAELAIDRIPRGGIAYLHVLSRHEITVGEIQRDPTSPFYGEPIYYEVRGARQQQRIHPSRVVRFLGAPYPDDVAFQADGWSDSILQAILDAVDQASSAAQHIAAMLPEAKQDIISVPGLSQWLSNEADTAKLTERFAYAQRMKSMFGMLVLEGDGKSPEGETYQQKQLSFAALPDVARLFLQIASGAADIPVTRMLGQAPAGLNATGDSDTRNYYDHVAAKQKVDLTPSIRRLDRALLRHALGDEPNGVWYVWNPLYQPTEKEKAEVGKIKADTIQTLVNTALVPEAVAAEGVKGWLTNTDLYPGIEKAYDAHKGPLAAGDPPQDGLGPDGVPSDPDAADNVLPFRRRATADAAARTLCVSRKLKNGADLIAWAKSQGIDSPMPAAELHVTIAYSRAAVDWMKIAPTWQGEELKVDAGGPRIMERFGEALVLLFASGELQWRHREILEAGATWDHPEFQPHVTVAWGAHDIDLDDIQPYNGPLVFGPEIFDEVDEGWQANAGEVQDARPFDGSDEAEIASVSYDDLIELFSAEVLESAGITRLTEDARRGRRPGAFRESDHPRGGDGRFIGKGGAIGGPRLTKGAKALKDSGVDAGDRIVLASSRLRSYRAGQTVEEFAASHPQGRAYALRKLAADHKAGRIGFEAGEGTRRASGSKPSIVEIDPKLRDGSFRARTEVVVGGIRPSDYLIGLTSSSKYPLGITVEQFVQSHPKGRDYAQRVIDVDRNAGRLQIERERAPGPSSDRPQGPTKAPRDAPLNAPGDERFRFGAQTTAGFRQDIRDGYDSIPAGIRARLEAAGFEIHAPSKTSEYDSAVAALPARGYPPGATMENTGGFFNPSKRHIVINETYKSLTSGRYVSRRDAEHDHTVRHEVGHAVDLLRSGGSTSPGFTRAYDRDVANFTRGGGNRSDFRYSYYLQAGDAGRSEMWAEQFAQAVRKRQSSADDLRSAFPETAKYMDELIARLS